MIKVAVLGAGLAGLATTWNLLQFPHFHVTLFDAHGIGGGASAIATGLLHPYSSADARLVPPAREGFHLALDLIQRAQTAVKTPLISNKGILRFALTERQQTHFLTASRQYPDLEWLSAENASARVPGVASAPALLISEGVTVSIKEYLETLWILCAACGAEFHKQKVESLSVLSTFDLVIVALGAQTTTLPELAHLQIRKLKGQILELHWPEDADPLPLTISGEVYLVPRPAHQSCLVSATFERLFATEDPEPELAEGLLRPKAEALFPALKGARLLNCRAGIRATTPSHQPLVGHVKEGIWILTGLGAKGLLYHAYYARQLTEEIVRANHPS